MDRVRQKRDHIRDKGCDAEKWHVVEWCKSLHFTDCPLQSLLFHWLAPCIDWNIELLHTDWCKVSLWYVSAIIKAASTSWGEEKLQNFLFMKKVERESKSPMSDFLSQLTHSKHRVLNYMSRTQKKQLRIKLKNTLQRSIVH